MARAALDCWQRQDYQNRELIVVDDKGLPSFPEGLIADRVHYRMIDRGTMTLGAKRNLVCSLASGELIAHFDSDDFSTPDRISDQVKRLQETGMPVTGYGTLLFWDILRNQAKRYHAATKGYVCGTTLCYLKSFWQGHQFPNKQVASDNNFVYPILRQIAASDDTTHMVARIHGDHTSKKNGINKVVAKELIPKAFWANEDFRIRAENLACFGCQSAEYTNPDLKGMRN